MFGQPKVDLNIGGITAQSSLFGNKNPSTLFGNQSDKKKEDTQPPLFGLTKSENASSTPGLFGNSSLNKQIPFTFPNKT